MSVKNDAIFLIIMMFLGELLDEGICILVINSYYRLLFILFYLSRSSFPGSCDNSIIITSLTINSLVSVDIFLIAVAKVTNANLCMILYTGRFCSRGSLLCSFHCHYTGHLFYIILSATQYTML